VKHPLLPEPLERDASGVPFSARYRDVYHSREGAGAQARHVFLAGNALPGRWAGRRSFTILETGFGLGANFLATWAAWRDDPHRCARLHFVSIEKHPLAAADLARTHDSADVAARALVAQWPPALPGLHRLVFEGGAVVLTLAFGDVAELLPKLRLGADAFYFDGFAPARNPEMWAPAVLKAAARLARDDATCATYTVARSVVDALAAGGFLVEKRPGFGSKRDMLVGRYAPRYRVRRRDPPAAAAWRDRHAIVLGAGLAGVSVAVALVERGWRATLVDRRGEPAAETSANPAAALHPMLSRDDNTAARLTRAGFLLAQRRLAGCDRRIHEACGFLECATSPADAVRQAETIRALGFPGDFARVVDTTAGSELAHRRVRHGGFWFPAGGWVRPQAFCAAMLESAVDAILPHWGVEVAAVKRVDERWTVLDADGQVIAAASVLVVATNATLARLAPPALLRIRPVRGQLTLVPEACLEAPRVVVGGDGYCLPAIDGTVVVGATYDLEDPDPHPRASLDADNLARLARLLPDACARIDLSQVSGRVGFRGVAVDRLPVIGAAVDEAATPVDGALLRGAHPVDLPRRPGLFFAGALGSRGIGGSALAAEVVASLVEGEPPPVEADLLDAIDPGRFLLRARRPVLPA